MNISPSVKRALIFISVCCLLAPPVSACSKDELEEYVNMDKILVDYKYIFPKAKEAHSHLGKQIAAETATETDVVRVCALEEQMNNLSLSWLRLDKQLEKTCPLFYEDWITVGKEARDLFNNNQSRHQAVVDKCVLENFLSKQD